MGVVWLRPSGPILGLVSLECRASEADFRSWGSDRRISFENLSWD